MSRPELIGHRGAPRERPENTISSFLRALDHGVDAIELDVHATADDIVVVHHDPVPRATPSDPALAGRPIARLTAAELAGFTVGSEERIPTLEAVLSAVADRATVYVEIKGRRIEQAVVECVRRSGSACAIHCFDHRVVRRVTQIAPDIPAGVLVAAYLLDPGRTLRETGARDYWLEWTFIDEELVRRVHDAGGRVIAWTVNGGAEASAFTSMGVDGICTDTVPEIRPAVEAAA